MDHATMPMRTEAEIRTLSLSEINRETGPLRLYGAKHGGTSHGRKSFFRRLVWLEKLREDIHGVRAKHRSNRG